MWGENVLAVNAFRKRTILIVTRLVELKKRGEFSVYGEK